MIIEGSSVPDGEAVAADICIVGAGPAGLTLAAQFDGSDQRVYVLESGGRHPDDLSLELSGGDITGEPYFPLVEARARVFGGSSYIWEEWMRARPLDPIDFESRPWISHSGWPFGDAELAPYYKEAHETLGLGPFHYHAENGSELPIAGGPASRVQPVLFRYSNTADFTSMWGQMEASANVCVVLGSTALELVPGRDASEIDHVVASTKPGHRFTVTPRVAVVAAGGIESPRLLLLSRARSPKGLGNEEDLVGRFFMEHPRAARGYVDWNGSHRSLPEPFTQSGSTTTQTRVALALSRATMEQSGVLNGMALLTPSSRLEASEAFRSLAILKRALGDESVLESPLLHAFSLVRSPVETARALVGLAGRSPGRQVHRISMTVEQAPNRRSRVMLGDRLDRFGQAVPNVHWSVGEAERRTMKVLHESIDHELRESGAGVVRGRFGDEWPARRLRGEWHQLGTTRMSFSPRDGVIDPACRVHGFANLYMAGGAVFPTAGYANPTLTIVALALRLASHLDKELRTGPSLGPLW